MVSIDKTDEFIDEPLEDYLQPLNEVEIEWESIHHLLRIHGRYNELRQEQKAQALERDNLYKRQSPPTTLNPCFYHVYQDTLPPKEAHLIIPVDKDQKVERSSQMG